MNKKIKVVGKCPVVEPLFTIKPKLLYFFLLIPLFESQSSSPAMEAQGNSSNSRKEKKAKRQEVNMEGPFGAEWPQEEKVKRREMVSPEALYIFVQEEDLDDKAVPLVGFVHYRFTLEEEIPVVYVYEIQLESRVQGKGLGKFLMQLVELIARKNCMSAIVLTVQKANVAAMDFYTNKMSSKGYPIAHLRCRWKLKRAMRYFAKHLIRRPRLHWRCPVELEKDDG
ncbi:N-alpha-acetyltransferase 40 [Linum perenne]